MEEQLLIICKIHSLCFCDLKYVLKMILCEVEETAILFEVEETTETRNRTTTASHRATISTHRTVTSSWKIIHLYILQTQWDIIDSYDTSIIFTIKIFIA
jgi:hypothetical protein